MGAPEIAIVIALRQAPASLDEAFAALLRQEGIDGAEVIVADGTREERGTELARRHGGVRRLARPRASLPELKAEAIVAARAPLVAIVDPWDAPVAGWLRQASMAFTEPAVAAVGGSVVFAGAKTAANRAAFLFEYGAFEPPLRDGPTAGDLPGNNVVYRRQLLEGTCSDLLRGEGFVKPFVHQRLRAAGYELALRAALQVRHLRDDRFRPFAARLFHHGRCFGAVRRRLAAPARRLLLLAGAPAAVPLLSIRHPYRARGERPATRAALAGYGAAWGLGEWLGAWFGAGGSRARLV